MKPSTAIERPLLFVDTWGWIVLADARDPRHDEVVALRRRHTENGILVTTDYVLDETFTRLYGGSPFAEAERFCSAVLRARDAGIVLGATVEEAGFDKRVDPDTIRKLHQAGVDAVPALANMRIHDAWAGLRPGTPDNLPILGETSLRGYYAVTGHYRDGILLAPITAQLMAELITGCKPALDLQPFSPLRFG